MGPIAGAVLNGKLYVSVPHKFIAVFDTKTQTWNTLIPQIAPRSCQMAAYNGEIWVMGGRIGEPEKPVPPSTSIESIIYSPLTGNWRKGPDLPRELAWGVAFVIGEKLLITGGAAGRCFSNRTFELKI